ncbi:MAG TPA: 30S ribosomal protein S4 [Clostridia bacterium]|nr:30S ribosomal protein S4 [Clostridia bacterium]
MTVYYSKKCRLCRAAGEKLFLKGERCVTKCPIDRKGAVPPGQHGAKRRRKPSDYGVRLMEKQKLKRIYGVSERELKKYFEEARKVREATGEAILQILESRLDNLVYRLGFAPSRRFARQLVSHKHVLVNGRVVNIASYRVKPEEVISLDETAMKIAEVEKLLKDKDFTLPKWLERKGAAGKLVRLPAREEIEANVSEQLIVEFYSR